MKSISKTYDSQVIERQWYTFWESGNFFKANVNSSIPRFCIIIPPPNVTGVLHMGHALVNTLQDIMARWKRMKGYEVLWVPGTDHAGIATQTVVERHLMKTEGKRRKDYPREQFLKYVWEWKEKNEHRILGQIKSLGCSCDWSRLCFTMDETRNRAVRTMFKKLYDEGLIYRGDYLVNWDPVTQTALADDEVEYEERESYLWHFKYPLKDGTGFVKIATTRPETMLGDTAIAVSPSDKRYTNWIGKIAILPLMEKEIPIIADRLVDPEFGTGMVKVTPAHDPNDYQMGHEHNLPFINIMTPDGKINHNGGKYQGLTMEEAREAIVKDMKELGLLEKVEPHTHRVGYSYRSKAVIEPYLSKQWFVKMSAFQDKLRTAVQKEKVKLIPKNWENTYYHWIDNLRDWCISRQLWWGHRIPIWYRKDKPEIMICYDGEGIPEQVKKEPDNWIQDEDVLDTWFSSSLWPFSTMGWPEKTAELENFYPNSVLITGHDILFFWVARMIMMGEYTFGTPPFPEVFLHGLIYGKSYWRDNPEGGITYLTEEERHEYDMGKPLPKDVHYRWEKMSKSKGNIINPLEIIEEYGTDAMRMALCSSATQSREIDLDRRKFDDFKNFTNKVWNGARFVLMNLEITDKELCKGLNETILSLEDHWLLSVLNQTVKEVNHHLENYAFDQAAMEAYDFYWKQFCSYYVEISKPILFGKVGTTEEKHNKQKLLVIALCQAIRLIHPMAPFISEELFQKLKERFPSLEEEEGVDPYTKETVNALKSEACMVAPYPEVVREEDINPEINETFDLVGKVVYAIRNIRGEMKVPPSTFVDVHIIGKNQREILKKNQKIIQALVKIKSLVFHEEEPEIGFGSTALVDGLKVIIPVPQEMIQHEKQRLTKEEEKLNSILERIRKQLENKDFVTKAPPQLIEKQRTLLEKTQLELSEITNKLNIIRE